MKSINLLGCCSGVMLATSLLAGETTLTTASATRAHRRHRHEHKDSSALIQRPCTSSELKESSVTCNCTASSDPVFCCNTRITDVDVCWGSAGCKWGLESRTCVWK